MKKLISLIFVALLASQMWAYTCSATVSGTGGTITLKYSSSNSPSFYSSTTGNTITTTTAYHFQVNVTPDANYQVATFTANGTDKKSKLSNNVYSTYTSGDGKVSSDMTYTVTFESTGGGGGSSEPEIEYTYVDLGLPSGTKWATTNLGASSATEAGNFYSFGETSTKDNYGSSYYSFDCSVNSNFTLVDNAKMVKDASCDPAVSIGTGWRTPTQAEMQELIDNCTKTSVTGGFRFTGLNGNSIIIPKSGQKTGSGNPTSTTDAYLWTRTVHTQGSAANAKAYYMNVYAYSSVSTILSNTCAYYGLPIRPIYVPSGTKVTATFNYDDNSLYTTKQVDKYGTPSVADPTKQSNTQTFTFTGWSPTVGPISVPTTYTASFSSSTRYYTVNFEVTNGTLDKSQGSYTYSGDINDITVTPNAGYIFDHWEISSTPIVLSTWDDAKEDNATLTAVCVLNNSYTIAYKDQGNVDYSGSNGSSLPDTHTDGTATDLVPGVKEGYTFDGWFEDSDCSGIAVTSLGANAVTEDVVLYAKWTVKTYSISYKDEGNIDYSGSNIVSLPTSHTYNVATALVAGVRSGYTFVGWYDNEACTGDAVETIAANSITDDITLYAKWTVYVAPGIELEDNIEASDYYADLLSTYEGQTVNVTLKGRTLIANNWNTLCLPFNFDTEGTALDGRIYELTECTTSSAGMTITFAPVSYDNEQNTEIVAGRPYLVWVDAAIPEMRFEGVTLTTFTPETIAKPNWDVKFIAAIPLQHLTEKTQIFISNNHLYYPNQTTGSNLRAFRAYFEIINANGMSYNPQRIRIMAQDNYGRTMEVMELDGENTEETRKYIEDGILVIERNGIRYDAQGKKLD